METSIEPAKGQAGMVGDINTRDFGEHQQLSRDHEYTVPDESWKCYENLSLQLAVAIPLEPITLTHLARMKAGSLLKTPWVSTEDVPLMIGEIFIANVCFEPTGSNLGVRIKDFTPRLLPASIRNSALDRDESSSETLEGLDRLEALLLKTSLCFGTGQMSLHEILDLAIGDVILLDRPVNAPVTVTARENIIATGRLVIASGLYAVEIIEIAQMSRRLKRA